MDNHTRNNFLKGFFYALGGTFLASTNYITAKYGLRGFNPETFSLIWTSSAAVYALLIVLATGHRRRIALPSNSIGKIALLGLTTGIGMILAWSGLSRLDPSFTAFLWRFLPVLTIAFSVIFLGERIMAKELFPIAIMGFGGLLSVIGRWHIVGIGTTLTLLACGVNAMQRLIAKTEVTKVHPNILVFYRVGIGAVVIALWTILTGKADFSNVKTSYWVVTLIGAFLGPCASFLLTFRSYRYWSLSRSSMVLTMEPLFVLPIAYLFLGKVPVPKELFGGFIILVGAFWLTWIHFAPARR